MKKLGYFSIAFVLAFTGAFSAFEAEFSPRVPASLGDSPDSTAQATVVMGQIDSIYQNALKNDEDLSYKYMAYDMAWKGNYDARMGFMAANPNSPLMPGNPYDTNNWQALMLRSEGIRNRQHALSYAGLQMMVLLRTNRSILSRKQENEVLMKYMDLTNHMSTSGTLGLTTDPLLLTASTTSGLGYPQYAYNPAPAQPDIPVGGIDMSGWQNPDAVINPIIDTNVAQ